MDKEKPRSRKTQKNNAPIKEFLSEALIACDFRNSEGAKKWLLSLIAKIEVIEQKHPQEVALLYTTLQRSILKLFATVKEPLEDDFSESDEVLQLLKTLVHEFHAQDNMLLYSWALFQVANYVNYDRAYFLENHEIERAFRGNLVFLEPKTKEKKEKNVEKEAEKDKIIEVIRIGDCYLRSDRHFFYKEESVRLSPREALFLELLMENADELVTWDELEEKLEDWLTDEGKDQTTPSKNWKTTFRVINSKIVKKLQTVGIPGMALSYVSSEGFWLHRNCFENPKERAVTKEPSKENGHLPGRTIIYDESYLTLTKMEYRMLKILLEHNKQIVPTQILRQQLFSGKKRTRATQISGISSTWSSLKDKLIAVGLPEDVIVSYRKHGIILNLDTDIIEMV